MLRKFIAKLYHRDTELDPAALSYLTEWERQHSVGVTKSVLLPASGLFFLGALLVLALSPVAPRSYLAGALFGGSLNTLLFYLLTKRFPRRVKLLMELESLITGQICFIGVAYGLGIYLRSDPTLGYGVVAGAIYCCIGILTILLTTNYGGRAFFLAFEFVLLGALAWSPQSPLFEALAWLAVIFAFAAFALTFQIINYRRLRGHAMTEFARQELVKQFEQLRVEALEKEMTLARQVQESLSPHFTNLETEDLTLKFYQKRHGLLSGDWMGVRTMPNHELILAVADVTGKGVPAAMVAQAINTLWARALLEDTFDPELWLAQLNKTLMTMGHAEPHTATVGVVVIGRSIVTYYSCGHIPVYVRRFAQGKPVYDCMSSSGNIVGMLPDLRLAPAVVNLDIGPIESIFLGTDGVFDHGSRVRQTKIHQFMLDLEQNGTKALEHLGIADDQLLIWVRRKNISRSPPEFAAA